MRRSKSVNKVIFDLFTKNIATDKYKSTNINLFDIKNNFLQKYVDQMSLLYSSAAQYFITE